MQNDNRPIKPKQIIVLGLVVLFYLLVIGGFIWLISRPAEDSREFRGEVVQAVFILLGLALFILLLGGIATVLNAIGKTVVKHRLWFEFEYIIIRIIRWFKK